MLTRTYVHALDCLSYTDVTRSLHRKKVTLMNIVGQSTERHKVVRLDISIFPDDGDIAYCCVNAECSTQQPTARAGGWGVVALQVIVKVVATPNLIVTQEAICAYDQPINQKRT